MTVGRNWGKGQIMLSEELLRVILDDRRREIEAAKWAHDARAASRRSDGSRTRFASRLSAPEAGPRQPQAGRAVTDSCA